MKYQPSLPEHNDNVSHQHPIRELLTLLLGVAGLAAIGLWVLGLFVDTAVESISPEIEARLFRNIDISAAFGKTQESDVQARVQDLVESLGQCHDIPFPLTVHLIDKEEINAIALPGGDIILYAPLLNRLPSMNGLTFVLAHELGHFKNRDHLRALGRGLVLTALVTYFTGSNSDVSRMLASTLTLGQAQHSQSRESQADETALEILNCSYGHVGGATELFEVLQKQEGASGPDVLHYFDTHPELQKRIDAIHDLSQKRGYVTKPTIPLDSRLAVQDAPER
ncbi:MAG: M48 family metallopeptidase [Nitrospirales bacterium]|nr:M48 family metallopeptidase [Nitrospira sp.]MDR4502153.1 M48 family metallopeptidase [Nitrospirales bacterium]